MFKRQGISIQGPRPHGLSIQRDDSGVPHIRAQNPNDANWGLGYCHAIDRGTQLLMMRILGQGRLCETLADNEDSLAIDLFFRRANWYQQDPAMREKQLKQLTPETRRWCQAYCDGVNAGLAAKKLRLIRLLGYEAEPWTIDDTLLLMRMSGYLTLSQSQAEVERLFIEMVQAGIETDKLAALFPIEPSSLEREQIEALALQERIVPSELLWASAIPRAMASNNWVIHGSKTRSGSAIMANDPHLEVNRLPNVWYEASLSAPDYRVMGFGMAGLPGILVGRSPDISWGATYTFMDTVDSWIEDCRDGKYRRGKSWRSFTVRTEIIKRKQHADVEQLFFENAHGVLEGDPNTAGFYLTTRWSPGQFGAQSLNASYDLSLASDAKTAMQCLGRIESAWNWVIADSKGNIAYQMSGLAPKRHPDWNGFTPAPGWDPDYDWQGFLKPDELPHSYNPKEGYIVTANQDLNHLGDIPVINMPMGDYRAQRIAQVLEADTQHDFNSCRDLQMDCYSLQAEAFLDVLKPLLTANPELARTTEAQELFAWDACYDTQSRGAVLFEGFYDALRECVFGVNGLGAEVLTHLSSQTGIFIDFYQNFDRCLLNVHSPWYSEINRDQAFISAFERMRERDTGKRWGEINRFRFINQLFQGKLPRFLGFDTDSFPLIGGRATPHQGQIYTSAGRATSFAPSIRLIADMASPNLRTCLAGGPSDNRLSPWYTSGIEDWLAGNFKTLTADSGGVG